MCNLKCLGNCDGLCDKLNGKCETCRVNNYGSFCNKTCPETCGGGGCQRETGECKKCKKGFWGGNCSQSCVINCEGGTCGKDNGECEQCKRGFWGPYCSNNCPRHCDHCENSYKCYNCSNGWYGVTCNQSCPNNCGETKSCNKDTGDCSACSLGYFGYKCDQNCSNYCDSTEMCDQKNGTCQKCKPGRKGARCTEMCSDQCKHSICFRNESCVNGCEDGWFGPTCADKCTLAIRNCAKCKGIEPETICENCSDSWYLIGSKCEKCPQNCVSCKSDEKCFQCQDNLFYGVTCNLTCDSACINKTCDIRGNCIHGCEKKKYGRKCDQDCPTKCKTCRSSSICLTCEDGFDGALCSSSDKGRTNTYACISYEFSQFSLRLDLMFDFWKYIMIVPLNLDTIH